MINEKDTYVYRLISVAALIVVVIVAVIALPQPIRYSQAAQMLERGEYDAARQAFAELGDYADAAARTAEAEKGLIYLDAQELLEQGERKAARAILEQIADFEAAAQLLEQIKCEMAYDQAAAYMSKKNYLEAAEQFRALRDFRDAAQKAQECQTLGEVKEAYDEGHALYEKGQWLEAYRTLAGIRDAQYEDTQTLLEEIITVTEERARLYAQQGGRGKLIAFLQLAGEIDATAGSALRQGLIGAETFEVDLAYFQFDPACLTACSTDTTSDEYTATMLYMLQSGEKQLTLMASSGLDKGTALAQFYTAQNNLGEVLLGYMSVYDIKVSVQGNAMEITVDYAEGYSGERVAQLTEIYESFCEQSVRELAEAGLLSSAMSRRERAEIIGEWVCFYLTYDEMKEIQNAGIAVEQAKGVCTTYAALYHRMCNLAGVPTYGQRGSAGERHIWLVHVDETGKIFYADPTWADQWEDDFTTVEEKPTVANFVEKYLQKCMEGAVREYRYSNYIDNAGRGEYLWASALWSTHTADRPAEEIIAAHGKLLGNDK